MQYDIYTGKKNVLHTKICMYINVNKTNVYMYSVNSTDFNSPK